MGTRWKGMLAPLGVSTGDGRRFLPAGVSNRELPFALKWQRSDSPGHDGSVVIGFTDALNIGTAAEAVKNDWISQDGADRAARAGLPEDATAVWGAGEVFDDVDARELAQLAEDVAEAKLLTTSRVIGPSVDPGAATAVLAEVGSDEPLTEERFEELFWESVESGAEMPVEFLFTEYEIAAATLVPTPAFRECAPFELDGVLEPADTAALVASVRSAGWSDLPLADRDRAWDDAEADKRVSSRCGVDGDDADWGCYAAAHLYLDDDADPETKGAYGFAIVDVIDGEPHIVPRAVYAVAGVLDGARGGTNIPDADQDRMKEVVGGLYRRMADEFDDDSIVAPWDAGDDGDGEGAADTAALVAALTGAAPGVPVELFAAPQLDELTPITVQDTPHGYRRVFGHVATHDTCHVGIRDVCATAPASARGYVDFHRYSRTTGGVDLPMAAGRITGGHGDLVGSCACCPGNDDHACNRLSAGGAIAHHDRMRTLAWGVMHEDAANNAMLFVGIVDPDADERDVALLSRRKVSGDWREIGGNLELVEVLALSREQPGFPLPRTRVMSGRQVALTAAGTVRQRPANAAAAQGVRHRDGAVLAEQVANRVIARLAESVPAMAELLAAGGSVTLDTTPLVDVQEGVLADTAAQLAAQVEAAAADLEAHDNARIVRALLAETQEAVNVL